MIQRVKPSTPTWIKTQALNASTALGEYIQSIPKIKHLSDKEMHTRIQEIQNLERDALSTLAASPKVFRILQDMRQQIEAGDSRLRDIVTIAPHSQGDVQTQLTLFDAQLQELARLHATLHQTQDPEMILTLNKDIRSIVLGLPLTRKFVHKSILPQLETQSSSIATINAVIERVYEHHLGLVISIAQKKRIADSLVMDLIQEGNLKLLMAIKYWEPSYGVAFSTYAHSLVSKAFLRDSRATREAHYLSLESPPSWNKSADSDQAFSLRDVVQVDTEAAHPRSKDQLEHVRKIIAALKPREQYIIRLYHGFDGELPHTLRQIGKVLDISFERARQIIAQVHDKISFEALRKTTFTDRERAIIEALIKQPHPTKNYVRVVNQVKIPGITEAEVQRTHQKFILEKSRL